MLGCGFVDIGTLRRVQCGATNTKVTHLEGTTGPKFVHEYSHRAGVWQSLLAFGVHTSQMGHTYATLDITVTNFDLDSQFSVPVCGLHRRQF